MAFASIQKFIYGPSAEERVKSWQQQIKKEARLMDREIRQLDGAQAKTKAQLKQLANKGDVKNAKLLAREVVRSNKQKDRLATSKARLNSINMQLSHQLCERTRSSLTLGRSWYQGTSADAYHVECCLLQPRSKSQGTSRSLPKS